MKRTTSPLHNSRPQSRVLIFVIGGRELCLVSQAHKARSKKTTHQILKLAMTRSESLREGDQTSIPNYSMIHYTLEP